MNEWIKARRRKLVAEFGGECVICGSNQNLEFAHIKMTELSGRGRGRKERLYDVIKNPGSYQLMCNNDHEQYDNVKNMEDNEHKEMMPNCEQESGR